MATEVRLPDMGEGIEDVTVSRWRVKVGDSVNEGDVIVEVATDKVDSEVPAPAAGTVLKILAEEGSLVPVSAPLAVIGAEGESTDAPARDATAAVEPEAPAEPAATTAAAGMSEEEEKDAPLPVGAHGEEAPDVNATPVARRVAAEKGLSLGAVTGTGPGGRITKEDVLASSEKPAGAAPSSGAPQALPGDLADNASLEVRRVAAQHNMDLNEVAQGRPWSSLTRYDVLSTAASRDAGESVTVKPRFMPAAPETRAASAAESKPAAPSKPDAKPAAAAQPARPAQSAPGELKAGEELVKHSRMRAAVARNTAQSLFTAPHVTTMWDVDMSAVLAHRAANKKAFAAEGVNLTITAYFFEAALAALRAVPAANASWTDDGVLIKRDYNLGMAVALPADKYGMGGLIVPVIHNAGELNLMGLAKAINELAERARNNQLRQEDLADGTFTISNYGTSGSRFQTPVIVQPQVGILGVGAVEKRAVVISAGHPLEPNVGDALSFRPMTTLGFSYDHRVLDGATADGFCAVVKKTLEEYK
jgi:2-oxoglutarate dehydrogenase E2 component (dihydrolipoamide succinyltransferase)